MTKRSVAERQILQDAIGVGFINDRSFAKPAATLRALTSEQVASAGVGAQHFAGRGDFEAFGHGFLGFDAFGSAHKVNFRSKRARNIGTGPRRGKRYFKPARWRGWASQFFRSREPGQQAPNYKHQAAKKHQVPNSMAGRRAVSAVFWVWCFWIWNFSGAWGLVLGVLRDVATAWWAVPPRILTVAPSANSPVVPIVAAGIECPPRSARTARR